MKTARAWDKDFNLLHTFGPGEDHERLPVEHPLADVIRRGAETWPIFLTVDELDDREQTSVRWSGRLDHYSLEMRAGAAVIEVGWREERHLHPVRWPSVYSTPDYSPTIPGADWFVEGRRFREVGREPAEDGLIRVTLRPVDLPSEV